MTILFDLNEIKQTKFELRWTHFQWPGKKILFLLEIWLKYETPDILTVLNNSLATKTNELHESKTHLISLLRHANVLSATIDYIPTKRRSMQSYIFALKCTHIQQSIHSELNSTTFPSICKCLNRKSNEKKMNLMRNSFGCPLFCKIICINGERKEEKGKKKSEKQSIKVVQIRFTQSVWIKL